ncbi:MAG: SLC13 family permease [Gaiellaceae bacterium]
MSAVLAFVALVAVLAAAVARWERVPDWAVAAGAAALLVLVGSISADGARAALEDLGPTVGFAAALLVLADGCRRAGLFAYFGAAMAAGARGRPRRLLGLVFVAAAGTTAVLSLDATIVLLTPVVFSTAARLRFSPRPHVYACTHLANSASLLLPVSNLTNLLAFNASGLSFARFAALMLLPWLTAIAIEWVVLARAFRGELRMPRHPRTAEPPTDPPVFALAVLGLTLVGFMVVEPVWAAVAGALVLAVRGRPSPRELAGAAEPGFLVFVLGLGVVVAAASDHGLRDAVDSLIPHGAGLPALIAIAVLAAVVANLVNNLPATLIMLPAVAAGGPGPVLAMLVGVNVGPNLSYVGSLATLLWRRVMHAHDEPTDIRAFTVLGLSTVPAILVAATAGLWLALQVV